MRAQARADIAKDLCKAALGLCFCRSRHFNGIVRHPPILIVSRNPGIPTSKTWNETHLTARFFHSTPLHHNYTVSLVNQITQFKTYGAPVLQTFLPASKSLIAVWIGINDVGDSSKYAVDFPTFYGNLTSTLFSSVNELYDLGYRSYLFMNLPPLDRTPGNQKTTTPHPNATQVAWYNHALAAEAEQFGKNKGDVEVRVFDAHARLSAMLDNPAQYGIVNTTDLCEGYDQPDIDTNYKAYGCPTPLDTYFWFNSGHMTSHVHRILAEELEEWLKE